MPLFFAFLNSFHRFIGHLTRIAQLAVLGGYATMLCQEGGRSSIDDLFQPPGFVANVFFHFATRVMRTLTCKLVFVTPV